MGETAAARRHHCVRWQYESRQQMSAAIRWHDHHQAAGGLNQQHCLGTSSSQHCRPVTLLACLLDSGLKCTCSSYWQDTSCHMLSSKHVTTCDNLWHVCTSEAAAPASHRQTTDLPSPAMPYHHHIPAHPHHHTCCVSTKTLTCVLQYCYDGRLQTALGSFEHSVPL